MDSNEKQDKYTTQIDLVRSLFDKWVAPLGLRWWNIETVYYDDPGEIIQRFRVDGENIVAARTFADWRYGTAKIIINVPALDGLIPADLEALVVHELCHILVNEMRENELHHEERVVTGLQKAFVWTRNGVI